MLTVTRSGTKLFNICYNSRILEATLHAMRIISTSRITEFYKKHADAKIPLEVWVSIIKKLEVKKPNELKQVFNSVDIIGNNRVIFDIKGNRYRIITIVLIRNKTVYIRWIGTHAEYDRIDAHSI